MVKKYVARADLGSGVIDKHGTEIFEGDEVLDGDGDISRVMFWKGCFRADGALLRDGEFEIVKKA